MVAPSPRRTRASPRKRSVRSLREDSEDTKSESPASDVQRRVTPSVLLGPVLAEIAKTTAAPSRSRGKGVSKRDVHSELHRERVLNRALVGLVTTMGIGSIVQYVL